MMREKLSIQAPQEPETPAMLYPRGGIRVCLKPITPVSHPNLIQKNIVFLLVRNVDECRKWTAEKCGNVPRSTFRVSIDARAPPKTG